MEWEQREERAKERIAELRERIAEDAGAIMIFLGAGLSYGVGRQFSRATFEMPAAWDQDSRFPSWSELTLRMKEELLDGTDASTAEAVERFFRDQDELDCAQLFRIRVGEDRYQIFLRKQFETRDEDRDRLTPSHQALVDLPISELFTTNYDRLIELAFGRAGIDLVVSLDPPMFLENEARRARPHLIKLHGDIDEPATIVLTRDDYAQSRLRRAEMFQHLAQQARFTTFLFVGFSLRDPTFSLIRDEARMVMGEHLPASYLVQEALDDITFDYLGALGVKVVELFSWNELPTFLRAINPRAAAGA